MIKCSEISKRIQPSLTRTLFNMARAYDDVIDFTLGDPDIQPHQSIKDAGCNAIQQGRTRYSQNAGLIELREVISSYNYKKYGLMYDPKNEIIATVGAMEGLFLALLSILNPDDEVIILAPYYVNYVQMVTICHGKPVIIEDFYDNESVSHIDGIIAAINKNTKAIVLNTPSNPSGKIISPEDIDSIADIAIKNDLVVITDEVYKCLIYDGKPFYSIATRSGMRERTILINSLSKEFCMTGWRIGYVMAPSEVISTMTKLQENVCACAPLPSQYAAIEALSLKEDYSYNMLNTFSKRRDVLYKGISSIPHLTCNKPEATFYLMVNISETGLSSYDFCCKLLKEAHVACVPGITYGKSCDQYIRMAFTIDENKIKEGIRRIAYFMKQYN